MRLVVLWMVVIFLFSSFPDMNSFYKGTWLDKDHRLIIDLAKIKWNLVLSWKNPFLGIPDYSNPNILMNKLGHVMVFSVLGLLTFRATRKINKAWWICTAYAAFDELHQTFTPGRTTRLLDIVLDSLISILAILLAYWFYEKLRSVRKKKPVLPT